MLNVITKSDFDFLERIKEVITSRSVLSDYKDTLSYRTGIRIGKGLASAVILPKTLLELWKIINICVEFNKIIIMQAANTGLTGGSTPDGDNYDRDVVIINTLNLDDLIVINEGRQIIAFPGTTLYQLEKRLSTIGRSPHSLIGSSCIGASVIGGICNNSGGNLVNRGPAYTELSLYVRLDENRNLELVNHLDIDLGSKPEEMINNLENKMFDKDNIPPSNFSASDMEYKERIRDVDSSTPSRFNSDIRRLYESSGCSGKIAVFAVRLDTFPKPEKEKLFFIGTNQPENFTNLRNNILTNCSRLPDMGEYMHRSYFDGSAKYCKDTFAFLKYFGTQCIPTLLALKNQIDSKLVQVPFVPNKFSDRLLQYLSSLTPDHLPGRIRDFRNRFEHYLLILASDESIEDIDSILNLETSRNNDYEYIECNNKEARDLLLHRYVAGSAPMRFGLVNASVSGELLPLDVALPRNFKNWHDVFPADLRANFAEYFRMGHFLCMVFHWDIVLKKGVDSKIIKKQILTLLDDYGAKYPAEHNVGHVYQADNNLKTFYRKLDPTNSFNSGIGKTSKNINYN